MVPMGLSLRSWLPRNQMKKEAEMLAEMGKPILLVQGRQDRLVPVKDSQRLHEMWKGSEIAVFEDCGHNVHEEYPEKFNRLVVEFLKR